MIAQFLTEMDTCMTAGNIYIIGATNRPDLLDPSILQPGRFDVMIYLGISNEPATRLSILQAKTRKINLSPNVSLEEVERSIPQNFTGADMFSLVSAAYTRALHRLRETISLKLADIREQQTPSPSHGTNEAATEQTHDAPSAGQNSDASKASHVWQGGPPSSRAYRRFVESLPESLKTVCVEREDFICALSVVKRSVTDHDLLMYARYRLQTTKQM
jgi:SpoVK/Ycf46/Vps4 family AAA+-type ATPase